ncbi:MAG: response regulator transcription factor [Sarcina sp.]
MSKILLLEDDDALGMAIEFNLDEEGFIVDRAYTVAQAKEKFYGNKYDLLLLDVMLPDGTGYDVCKMVRTISEVPIIFLTACDDEVNIILGLEIGADDYITKPFRAKELITRMRANIRRWNKNSISKGIINTGNLEININTSKVSKNGESLNLTAQEYKIILTFIDNPINVLSKEQILDRIYEFDSSLIDDKTLAVYIRRIREKIEADVSNPSYIITKRGLGYMWNKNVVRN